MKYRVNKNVQLIPVIKPIVGQLYHVSWANSRGVVGRCIEVNETTKTVKLRTPKTGIEFKNLVNWSDLRHTRKNQITNKH